MTFTLFGFDFSVRRAPRAKTSYASLHSQVAGMKVDDVLTFPDHYHIGRCAMADALVKGAKKHDIKIKTSHKDGELVIKKHLA